MTPQEGDAAGAGPGSGSGAGRGEPGAGSGEPGAGRGGSGEPGRAGRGGADWSADERAGELSNPTVGGEQAERSERNEPVPGNVSGPRDDRPDIRAAKAETSLRRWVLVLLIAAPAVYFIIQRFS